MRYFSFKPGTVVDVSGEDAFAFLQSQFSQDLRPLKAGTVQSVYGLWLNRKGKVRADSYLLKKDAETLRIISPYCPSSLIIEKLDRHIIADDVVLTDITTDWWLTRFFGTEAPSPIPLRTLDESSAQLATDSDVFLLSNQSLNLTSPPLTPSEASYERLLRKECHIPLDVTDDNWPQEAGLDVTAVSFTKGCYLGQEVMAHLRRSQGFRRKILPISLSVIPDADDAPLYMGTAIVGHIRTWADGPQGLIGMAQIRYREIGAQQTFTYATNGVATLR